MACAKLGQYRQALSCFERKLELSERMSNPHFISGALNNMGLSLVILGDYHRAEEVLQRARVINERRYRVGLIHCLLNLAKRAHWSGEVKLALERYRQLLGCATELEYWTTESVAHAGIGLCQLELGEPEEARQSADRAMSIIADRQEWFENRDFVEILLAHVEALGGDAEGGAQRLERACAALAENDLFVWTQVALERVQILMRFDPGAARELLDSVIAQTRGIEFSLDGEIDRLRALLEPVLTLRPPAAS